MSVSQVWGFYPSIARKVNADSSTPLRFAQDDKSKRSLLVLMLVFAGAEHEFAQGFAGVFSFVED